MLAAGSKKLRWHVGSLAVDGRGGGSSGGRRVHPASLSFLGSIVDYVGFKTMKIKPTCASEKHCLRQNK